jgi:hypothetical protein
MTYYARLRALIELSEASTYDRSNDYPAEYTFSPTKLQPPLVVAAATTGETVDLTHFTSVTGMLLRNLSTTAAETIRVDWYEEVGSQAVGATGYTFANANPDTIADADAAGTFVTNGARAGDWVVVTASTTAARDGTYLIQTAAVDLLTVGANHDFAAVIGTDATSALSFQSFNSNVLPASGGFIMAVGSIQTAAGLALTSASGTPNCEITLLGA